MFFESQADFRSWLQEHHASEKELLLGFYKTKSKKGGIAYKEAVDQALCFGWIDGVTRSLGDESYTIRFTPRRKRSIWSQVNIRRMEELREIGVLHESGIREFENRDPKQVMKYSSENRPEKLDDDSEAEFKRHHEAWEFFCAQPKSYRMAVTWLVISAKQEETRRRRLQKLIDASARGERWQ